LTTYRRLAHVTYVCQYHLVFCPKYRYRVLRGQVARVAREAIRQICDWKGVEIEEGHVSRDHVHHLVSIPPKYSVSEVVGTVKGRAAIRLFKHVPALRRRGYRRSFWSRGYFVSTVGINEEIIRRYVQHQEMKERQAEQRGLEL
jgi:putative transposase